MERGPTILFAGRDSQAGVPENTWKTQTTLFLLALPLLLFFLFGVYSFDLGNVPITSPFMLGILAAGMFHVRVQRSRGRCTKTRGVGEL